MNEEQFIFGVLSLLSLLCALGLIFVKIDNSEKNAAKIFLVASLYKYRLFKYFAALCCLIISIISGLKAFGVLQ
jgi:hypothetical protein